MGVVRGSVSIAPPDLSQCRRKRIAKTDAGSDESLFSNKDYAEFRMTDDQ